MPGERELREANESLGARDAVLAGLVRRHGRPDPFVWAPVDDVATTRFAGSERHLAGTLDTEGLDGVSDDEAMAALTAARGVGPWTAQMFLIHELRRPDVLPAGDLGIRHAVAAGWPRSGLPSTAEVAERGRGWRPYRTYAAALLWTSLRPDTEEPLTESGRH